jgi:ribonuclease HII
MVNHKLEKKLFAYGYQLVGGIDEAGRGPLAGPVVAACVACAPDFKFKQKKLISIDDSKKLTEEKRESLFATLKEKNLLIGVGVCNHQIIDRINILQATFLAMRKAIDNLEKKPDYIIVDGKMALPKVDIKQQAIVDGDSEIFLVAAASIIAKVTRDQMMRKLHRRWPQYNFIRNKGYGTEEHLFYLRKFGPCPIHRKTFLPVTNLLKQKPAC